MARRPAAEAVGLGVSQAPIAWQGEDHGARGWSRWRALRARRARRSAAATVRSRWWPRCRGEGGGEASVTVIVNTGDDLWLAGVRLMPDFDSLLYSLAGVNDTERGWGRAGETERVAAELREWGVGWPWFTLGDLDLGTHLARTAWLREGATPSQVADAAAGALAARRAADPRDRHRGRHARARRRPRCTRRRARAALPGVVDPLPRRAARDRVPAAQPRCGAPGARRRRGDRGRRSRAVRPVEPGGLDRHDPLGAGHPRGASARRTRRSSASRRSSAARSFAAWPTRACR